jgi:hypothetical protein
MSTCILPEWEKNAREICVEIMTEKMCNCGSYVYDKKIIPVIW